MWGNSKIILLTFLHAFQWVLKLKHRTVVCSGPYGAEIQMWKSVLKDHRHTLRRFFFFFNKFPKKLYRQCFPVFPSSYWHWHRKLKLQALCARGYKNLDLVQFHLSLNSSRKLWVWSKLSLLYAPQLCSSCHVLYTYWLLQSFLSNSSKKIDLFKGLVILQVSKHDSWLRINRKSWKKSLGLMRDSQAIKVVLQRVK